MLRLSVPSPTPSKATVNQNSPERRRARSLSVSLDLVGVVLVVVAIAWTFISARPRGSDPTPVAALLGVCILAFAIGRFVAPERWLVPLLVTAGGMAILARSPTATLDRGPLGGPLGYVNARAALFAQGVAAASMLAVMWRRRRVARVLAIVVGAAFVVVTVAASSAAAMAASLGVIVAAFVGRSPRAARVIVIGSAAVFLVVLSTTVALAAAYAQRASSGAVNRIVDASVGAHRVELWHEGFSLMRDHPATGVGAGRFKEVSRLAQSDVDSRWAHHAFLQQGAEAGVPGFALLVLVFMWGFARLWTAPTPNGVAAIGAAALAAIGIQACVDYVLHFAVVPIAGAALLGTAASHGRRSS